MKINQTHFKDQIGSDEVGTGDFFGPVVVVAAAITKDNIAFLQSMNIKDSKKLSDKQITEIANKIIKSKNFEYFLYIRYFNDIKDENLKKNMNKLKSYLHNYALYRLHLKQPKIHFFCMDQFAEEKKYYEYLDDYPQKEEIIKNIHFCTQGEDHFLSVALASILARFFFIEEIKKLRKKYKINISGGAGKKADEYAILFIRKYGIKELEKIVKTNFKNYQKLCL